METRLPLVCARMGISFFQSPLTYIAITIHQCINYRPRMLTETTNFVTSILSCFVSSLVYCCWSYVKNIYVFYMTIWERTVRDIERNYWGKGAIPPHSSSYNLKEDSREDCKHEGWRVSSATEWVHGESAREDLGAPSAWTGQSEDHREFRRLSMWNTKTMCCNLLLIVIKDQCIVSPCYTIPPIGRYVGRVVSVLAHVCN
jgi:hypothetical protein